MYDTVFRTRHEQCLISFRGEIRGSLTGQCKNFPPIMIKKLDNFLNAPAVGLFALTKSTYM